MFHPDAPLRTANKPLRVPTQTVEAAMALTSCERLYHHHLVAGLQRHVEVDAVGDHARVDEHRHMLAHRPLLVKDVIAHVRRSAKCGMQGFAQCGRAHVLRCAVDVARQGGSEFDVGHRAILRRAYLAINSLSCGCSSSWMFSLIAPGTRLRAKSRYIVGTTKMVSSVPSDMPPTITQPIWMRLSAPAPCAVASGTAPSTIAPVVIRIGRRRCDAAFATASTSSSPNSRSWFANSTIRMPCLVIRPT